MTEELRAALGVLVAHANTGIVNAALVVLLLEAYPPIDGETPAAALGRMQAEIEEVFEGLIGSVMGPEDI